MDFGISSYVWVSPFTDNTLNQLKKAKDLGFNVYEVCIEEVGSFDVYKLKDEADRVGISANICGAFGPRRDIGSEDAEVRKEAFDYLKTCIDYASITNSPYVSGPMYATSGVARLCSQEERTNQEKRIVEGLKRVAEYADKKNVKLAIEPLNRFETDVMNTVEQGLTLFEKIDADNVGFLLDVFHMNIEEKSIEKAIKLAGNKIVDFHACANDRGIPGEDHFDWIKIKNALKEVNYNGPIVIESFSPGIKEIAKSVSLWRPVAPDMDTLAIKGLDFLKSIFC